MELRSITKNTAILAAPKIFNFFIKLIRAKFNAIFLGATGVGIISQIQILINKTSGVSLLAMDIGCQKLIAQHKDKNNKQVINNILYSYSILIILLIAVVYLIGLIFNKELANFILGEKSLTKYFFWVYVFFPLIPLSSIPNTILTGYKRFKLISKKEFITIIILFLTFVPLVYFYGVWGAIINFSLSIVLNFIFSYHFAFNKVLKDLKITLMTVLRSKFSKKFAKEMITIGGIGATLGYYEIFCEITSRGILVNNLGINRIGIYAPIIAWSGLFTSFIYPSIWTYLFPRLSEANSDKEVILVVNDVLRLITFLTIPFVFGGIGTRKWLIPIFYSSEFLDASNFLPLHFLGIFFFGWMIALIQIFTPTGRIKKFVPFGFINNTLSLGVIFFFTPVFGLWAWAIKFSIIPMISFVAYYIFFKYEFGFYIKRENKLIGIYAILFGLILWAISCFNTVLGVFVSIIFSILPYFLLKKHEKEVIIKNIILFKRKVFNIH